MTKSKKYMDKYNVHLSDKKLDAITSFEEIRYEIGDSWALKCTICNKILGYGGGMLDGDSYLALKHLLQAAGIDAAYVCPECKKVIE